MMPHERILRTARAPVACASVPEGRLSGERERRFASRPGQASEVSRMTPNGA